MNMKFLPLAAACLLVGQAAAGDSVEPNYEYEHTLTINLQLVSEGPNEEKNGPAGNVTESNSFIIEKYSNKEILEELRDSGVIPSISGWSIVLVTDDEGDVSGFRLKKKGTPSIDLENLSLRTNKSPSIEAFTGTTIGRTGRYTATEQEISVSTFSFDTRGIELSATGNFRTVFAVIDDSEAEIDTKIVQNITCSNLSGYGFAYDDMWETTSAGRVSIQPIDESYTFIVYGGFIASSVKKVEVLN